MNNTNIDFLQNSTFGYYINLLKSSFKSAVTNNVTTYTQYINSLDGDFLNLAIKAFGFNVIEGFNLQGKKFFNALPTITTFESFISLVESIFLTKQITINYLAPCKISLNVVNKNYSLLSNYVDNTKVEYVDNHNLNYIGFKEHDFFNLEDFFKKFLQPFLPAGVVLESINLATNNKDK